MLHLSHNLVFLLQVLSLAWTWTLSTRSTAWSSLDSASASKSSSLVVNDAINDILEGLVGLDHVDHQVALEALIVDGEVVLELLGSTALLDEQ